MSKIILSLSAYRLFGTCYAAVLCPVWSYNTRTLRHTMSLRFNSCLWHSRPRSLTASSWASVWFSCCRTSVVL